MPPAQALRFPFPRTHNLAKSCVAQKATPTDPLISGAPEVSGPMRPAAEAHESAINLETCLDPLSSQHAGTSGLLPKQTLPQLILENIKSAGVHQANKATWPLSTATPPDPSMDPKTAASPPKSSTTSATRS